VVAEAAACVVAGVVPGAKVLHEEAVVAAVAVVVATAAHLLVLGATAGARRHGQRLRCTTPLRLRRPSPTMTAGVTKRPTTRHLRCTHPLHVDAGVHEALAHRAVVAGVLPHLVVEAAVVLPVGAHLRAAVVLAALLHLALVELVRWLLLLHFLLAICPFFVWESVLRFSPRCLARMRANQP